MRLPHALLDSQYFLFNSAGDLHKALGTSVDDEERATIDQLAQAGLPPVTSRNTLATLLGLNPGLIWSMERKPLRHYRTFLIPKGNGRHRRIDAPRVALKLIQKWLSIQLAKTYNPAEHVFGFISGRSHVDAARVHVNARWVFSVDIRDFFQTTPIRRVLDSLKEIGFNEEGALLIANLTCLNAHLAQGAPTSPTLSNICFAEMDSALLRIARESRLRLSRYADDIVFSGTGEIPAQLQAQLVALFTNTPWTLAEDKTSLAIAPKRLKVHGLLVSGNTVRLTKGYRNRLRAYEHLLTRGQISAEDLATIRGHLAYAKFVEREALQ